MDAMLTRSLEKIAPAFVGHSWSARIVIGVIVAVTIALSFAVAPGAPGAFAAALGLIMLLIALVDARRFIIPNELVVTAASLGVLYLVIDERDALLATLVAAGLRALVLGLLFLGLRQFYLYWRGRDGLGLGDVKLAACAGLWLDWPAIPIAVEIAALAAIGVYVLGHVAGRRRIHAATRLPFGLFLAPAIWIAWLLQYWLYA
jgi:leader peptidase (prepilin peptidase)/N-methyltransferase